MIRSPALLFATTSYFMERMGLKALQDLPPLAPQLPEVEELEAELGQLAGLPRAQPTSTPVLSSRTLIRSRTSTVTEPAEGVRLQKVLACRDRLSPGMRSPDQRGTRRGELRGGY